MVEAAGPSVPDYKAFRSVTTPFSCSMLMSNLSSKDGTNFVMCKNTTEGGTINLYGPQVVSQTEDTVEPQVSQASHKSDCMRVQFLKVAGTHFVVACHIQVCIIYNSNCTRRLFSFDIAQAIQGATDRPVNVA